jgi:hypothetical protein
MHHGRTGLRVKAAKLPMLWAKTILAIVPSLANALYVNCLI